MIRYLASLVRWFVVFRHLHANHKGAPNMRPQNLRPSTRNPWVCGRCGRSDGLTFKAHYAPNTLRVTWEADDADDVWCEHCQDWGVGAFRKDDPKRREGDAYRVRDGQFEKKSTPEGMPTDAEWEAIGSVLDDARAKRDGLCVACKLRDATPDRDDRLCMECFASQIEPEEHGHDCIRRRVPSAECDCHL